MPYKKSVLLYLTSDVPKNPDEIVERFLMDGVKLVGVVGISASSVEELVGEIVDGDGSYPDRFILTSSHVGESFEEALEFARLLSGDLDSDVQVIEIEITALLRKMLTTPTLRPQPGMGGGIFGRSASLR